MIPEQLHHYIEKRVASAYGKVDRASAFSEALQLLHGLARDLNTLALPLADGTLQCSETRRGTVLNPERPNERLRIDLYFSPVNGLLLYYVNPVMVSFMTFGPVADYVTQWVGERVNLKKYWEVV